MKEIHLAEREVEEIEFMDLGDAAAETRQLNPEPMWPDSIYGYGRIAG